MANDSNRKVQIMHENSLGPLTFEEIASMLDTDNSQSGKSTAGRRRLLSVVNELKMAGTPGERKEGNLGVMGHNWRLESVSIRNFRGVGNDKPLEVKFLSRQGVSILTGPNGSGKSSITEAVNVALTGVIRPDAKSKSPTAEIWQDHPVYAGGDKGEIALALTAGSATLRISAEVCPGSEGVSRNAILSTGDEDRAVDLPQAWNESVIAYSPVLAYGDMERRLQSSTDLNNHFAAMLSLGGCFDDIRNEVAERSKESRESRSRLDLLWKEALAETDRLKSAWAERLPAELLNEKVERPAYSEDVDEWVLRELLGGHAYKEFSINRHVLDDLFRESKELRGSCVEFSKWLIELGGDVAAHLNGIAYHFREHGNAPSACPICNATDSGWLERLIAKSDDMGRLSASRDAFYSQATKFSRLLDEVADAVRDEDERLTGTAGDSFFEALWECAADLQQSLSGAQRVDSVSLRSAERALNFLDEKSATAELERVREAVEDASVWRKIRTKAFTGFVEEFKASATQAALFEEWQQAESELLVVERSVLDRRSHSSKEVLASRLGLLLGDAGLELTYFEVKKRKPKISLTSNAGLDFKLGMLSAGQRNALLLAPLLRERDAGIFRFLILDDPVQAFDELRIQGLAAILGEIGRGCQVVVMSHDRRLQDYMQLQPGGCEAYEITRSPALGEVQVAAMSLKSKELLEHAERIYGRGTESDATLAAEAAVAVRSLIRMALDEAFKEFVMKNAAHSGGVRDFVADLEELDAKGTLKERLRQLNRFVDPASAVKPNGQVMACCSARELNAWNDAAHGSPSDLVFSGSEISNAQRAIDELMGLCDG